MNPYDPLRDAPLSFDQWCATFDLDTPENRDDLDRMRTSASILMKNALVRRVMAQMECNAMRYLADCPLGDEAEAHRRLMLLSAARALPKALQAFAEDREFEEQRNQAT